KVKRARGHGSGAGREEGAEVEEEEKEGGEEEEKEEEDDFPEDVEIQGRTEGSGPGDFGSKYGSGNALDLGHPARPKDKKKQRKVTDGNDTAAAPLPREGLWTDAMRSVLRIVVLMRLGAYPTSLEQDEHELETRKTEDGGVRVGKGKGKEGKGKEGKGKGTGRGAGGICGHDGGGTTAAEAEAAWRSALLLRVGEKRLLREALRHLQ
ncbi:hypothetical protein Vafri_9198, partial [Volvox africanus]